MQLRRWNVRKNATQKEWLQYFSNNQHPSIPTSIDAPGTNPSTVILSKSIASKKRARRWVSGSHVESSTSQASSSTLPGNAAQLVAASLPNEPLELRTATQPDVQDLSTDVTNTFGETATLSSQMDPGFSSMVTTSDFVGSTPPGFFDVLSGHAQFLDPSLMPLHTLSSPAAPDLQPPFFRQHSLDGAAFQDVGLPLENNMVFFNMLKNIDFKQKLPSAQLEHILQPKGIVLDKAAARTIFGGFARRLVADILSSKDQSMARRPPNLEHFLSKLGSQVPGESSALITDDQAFETKFARVLLFSMLNGFAGLDDVPMENILRFLNRFVVNKLLLHILEQCPPHVSRTLADNIFRASIEATDTNAVKLLVDRKLVDVNETACFWQERRRTPIQRASYLMSPRLMQALIDGGADVNKVVHAKDDFIHDELPYGAMSSLRDGIDSHLRVNRGSAIPPESREAWNILVAAGARVHPELMILDHSGRTVEFDLLVSQNVPCESHRGFFEHGRRYDDLDQESSFITGAADSFDDRSVTILFQTAMNLCHEASCNKCLVDFSGQLRRTVFSGVKTGKIELVQLLLDKVDLRTELPQTLMAAIESQNHTLIDLILSKGPDLDPPAMNYDLHVKYSNQSTPIAEAVRYGNEDLIRRLEAGGSLDRLSEGGRFGVLVDAAAEAGNTAYMSKLLTRAVTSKQAYRIMGDTLICAVSRDHDDIAQMLLEAGSLTNLLDPGSHFQSPLNVALRHSNAQMVRDLIAAGDHISQIQGSYISTREHRAIVLDLVHEYPGLIVGALPTLIRSRIELDTLDLLKEILKTWVLPTSERDDCLAMAVKFGHADLVEYLLDMGASPFSEHALRAAIPDRPDILRQLFQKERLRQTMPKCIGAYILASIMDHGAGNAEALDELITTEAINFARLEHLYDDRRPADVREEYSLLLFTPLGLAIQGVDGHFDTNMIAMEKFLDAGADPDGIAKCNERWTKGSPLMTALMVAIETGREDAVNMLLDYGADVNARPRIRTTRTALQYAAELGNMDMVRLLLSRGADANSSASSHGGATALQFASMSGNCNMVAHLLDHGAQLDALPSRIDGMWPLEGAAANGRLDMIRYLWELKMRADMAGMPYGIFSDRHCLRAMSFAVRNGHIGCRDFVSELSGISVDRLQTDEYGALWIAY